MLRRFALIGILLLVVQAARAEQVEVGSAVPFGNPTWKPVGFVLFSAPIGTQESGFAEFLQSAQKTLPEPNYTINPNTGGVVPVPAHAGPYDDEFVQGVAASGFKSGTTYLEQDFAGANGIFFGFMLVPTEGAPQGTSPDYASGPIIPNDLFDITFNGKYVRNGEVFDSAFDAAIFDVRTCQ